MKRFLALIIAAVMLFALCACGTEAADTAESAPSAEQLDAFRGDWYGYWIMTDPTGQYEEWTERFWDCCATIKLEDDGVGSLTLTDEDLPEGTTLGEVFIKVSASNGYASSINGRFFDADVAEGQWAFAPNTSTAENMIIITGQYESEAGNFGYTIILRPWGLVWDDVSEDYLPYYYNTWYLPLIQNGEQMPSVMMIP